jgi:hypothetical protein
VNRLTVFVILIGLTVIGIVGFIILDRSQKDEEPTSNNIKIEQGTSVVILLDFSKSFPASYDAEGNIIYGFRREDQRVLETLNNALTEIAVSGVSKCKIILTQIQTSSIIENPLCPPIEIAQKLIKKKNTISTKEQLRDTLNKCIDIISLRSKNKKMLSDYTDISGAITMASDISRKYSNKLLVIFSDFNEELPPGVMPAKFKLNGEKVVLIHRPGIEEKEGISGYLKRIQDWKKKLAQNGAQSVATLPVFSTSNSHLLAAIKKEKIGTAINILVDCKENRFSLNKSADKPLVQVGKALAEFSRDMPVPITALWMSIGESGFYSKALPFVEFYPHLVKTDKSLNTIEDFSMVMEELAHSVANSRKVAAKTDISGSLALIGSIDPPAKSSILVIISDLLDDGFQTNFKLAPNTQVVMIHIASQNDRNDPNLYLSRRQEWEKRFYDQGAVSVCQIPLIAFTQSDLISCLSNKN